MLHGWLRKRIEMNKPLPRYSVYLLYQYKRTNTDAKDACRCAGARETMATEP